ncbi:MAG: MFS transporter [Pseudomonadota bacterium]
MAASAPAPPSALLPVVAATLAGQALVSMGVLTLPAIAPNYAEALGVDPALIGYQISLTYAAAMLSTGYGGGFTTGWGACRTTQAGLMLVAAGATTAMTASLPALALASVFLGLGYELTNPAASHLLVRFTPEARRNLIFSVKQTGVPAGGVAAALCGPALAVTLGWRWSLALVALACVALTALLQRRRAAWDNDRVPGTGLRQMTGGGMPIIWRDARLRRLALAAFCFAGVQLCVMTFTVTLLVKEAGYSLVQAGLLLSGVQVAGVLGRVAWGWSADFWGSARRVLATLGALMTVLCVAVTQLAAGWPAGAIWLVFLGLGATAVGWNGVFLADVARLAPRGQTALATGGALFFTFGGVLVAPALFSSAYHLVGSYALTFAVAAAFAAAGVASITVRRSPD